MIPVSILRNLINIPVYLSILFWAGMERHSGLQPRVSLTKRPKLHILNMVENSLRFEPPSEIKE